MPGIAPVFGLPGLSTQSASTNYIIFRQGGWQWFLGGGKLIDGVNSRDPGNSPIYVLRPGLLMGKITTSGLYAPSIIGTISAYTSGGTTLTVSAAVATEVARRVGTSGTGTLKVVGPPTANGTVATTAVTYSAVGATTITVTSLGVDKVAGSFLTAADGSQVPLSMIPDGNGTRVVDVDGLTNLTVPFELFPVGGEVTASNLLPVWPTDTSLQAYITGNLSTAAGGKFAFAETY